MFVKTNPPEKLSRLARTDTKMTWNEFLIATTFLQSQDRLTAVVSFFLLSGQYSSDWGEIMAAALIIVAPVVILFVFLQRRFIEGMAGGSVKG